MNIGMLWYDNDPKAELTVKIKRAAQYYRNKYGKTPTLCYVHPSMLPGPQGNGAKNDSEENTSLVTEGVEVRTNHTVLPNHFWIGVNGKANVSAMNS